MLVLSFFEQDHRQSVKTLPYSKIMLQSVILLMAKINPMLASTTVGYAGDQSPTRQHLIDSSNRRLRYLRLSVTDFCNFRCAYCLPHGYTANGGKRPDNELSIAEIHTLLTAFAQLGTTKVRLTGGEPSIRKDLPDIIAQAKSISGIHTVAVSSNGYHLHKHIANWHAAGLDALNISIDSFDPAQFKAMTGFDILPTLLRDIDRVLDTTQMSVKINAVLMAETVNENLIEALSYIKTRPITYRLIELMQTTDNHALFFAEHARAQTIKTYLLEQGWQPQLRHNDAGPAIEYMHRDYVGKIGVIEPYAPRFCDGCNRLRVSSQGKIHLCLFDREHYDIRPFLSAGDDHGLIDTLQRLMPAKPSQHYLSTQDSGIMNNLSMIGG